MKRPWLFVLLLVIGALAVILLGRRQVADRRERAFREELETLPSLTS